MIDPLRLTLLLLGLLLPLDIVLWWTVAHQPAMSIAWAGAWIASLKLMERT